MKKTICQHCGYELKEDEITSSDRCPMCGKVHTNSQITKKKEESTGNIVCPKCNYKRKNDNDRNLNKCPKCGVIYSDYYNSIIKKLSEQNNELIKKAQNSKDISFKPLLIPLWTLILINLGIFGYEYIKTGTVSGTAVTPVYITGGKILPVSVQEATTLPISIEYASGNIPVVIKGPLSTGGNVCARPCGF